MKHIVIITGGHLDIDFAKAYLETLSYDKVFAVDKGLEYIEALGVTPDCVLGDFDTVDQGLLEQYETGITNGEISALLERHPAMKDATDTELAVDMAMKMGAECITLLAAIGSRLDHLLANVALLVKTAKNHVNMHIVDAYNRIRILSENDVNRCVILKEEQFGQYISLLPVSTIVEGVTLRGALYPLKNAIIYQGESRTVSNEMTEMCMEIEIARGTMLVIESKDK